MSSDSPASPTAAATAACAASMLSCLGFSQQPAYRGVCVGGWVGVRALGDSTNHKPAPGHVQDEGGDALVQCRQPVGILLLAHACIDTPSLLCQVQGDGLANA
jgi:hypothetical protein